MIPGVLVAAVLFGLAHFINLIREPGNTDGIGNQVVFACCIGIYFGALLLRTRNILLVGFVHGLINFVFALKKLLPPSQTSEATKGDLFSILLTYSVFAAIAACGFYLLHGVKEKESPVSDARLSE
jgi:hypothetical protein